MRLLIQGHFSTELWYIFSDVKICRKVTHLFQFGQQLVSAHDVPLTLWEMLRPTELKVELC